MENEEIGPNEMSLIWQKLEESWPTPVQTVDETQTHEVDSPDETIEPLHKKIQLSGSSSNELWNLAKKTGVTTWTDGFTSNGPYLPERVENEICDEVGNDEEYPFIVTFGIDKQHPMDFTYDHFVTIDYKELEPRPSIVSEKLSKMFSNVGGSAQSAEFGGNDVWLLKGDYPLTEPGQTATMLAAGAIYRGRVENYDIFTRTVTQDGEYDDKEIASGTIQKLLPMAKKIKGEVAPSAPIKEVETPAQVPEETFPTDSEEAIARRVHDETPSPQPFHKVIQLSGSSSNELMHLAKKTGVTTWTDGFRSNGPYLPERVEREICDEVGNDDDYPFIVRFIIDKHHPMDFTHDYFVTVDYEELEPRPVDPHEFGNRDMGA